MNTPTDALLQKVLVRTDASPWGICGEYRGAQADLIAAGVAAPYMFEDIGKSGTRTRRDEFGDRYIVRRRAQGVWHLTRFIDPDQPSADITENRCADRKWYREAKARVDQAMNDIMTRIQSRR